MGGSILPVTLHLTAKFIFYLERKEILMKIQDGVTLVEELIKAKHSYKPLLEREEKS